MKLREERHGNQGQQQRPSLIVRSVSVRQHPDAGRATQQAGPPGSDHVEQRRALGQQVIQRAPPGEHRHGPRLMAHEAGRGVGVYKHQPERFSHMEAEDQQEHAREGQ